MELTTDQEKKRADKINEGRRKFFQNSLPLAATAAGIAALPAGASADTPAASFDRKVIEPLPWQAGYGFVTGNVVSGQHRSFYMAGQGPTDENGMVVHPDSMAGQINQTLDNMEAALTSAGMDWSNLINLSVFTTDMQGFFEVFEETLHQRVTVQGGARFGGALLQISGFAFPDMKVELVGHAVQA